jgi:hypothetical protein
MNPTAILELVSLLGGLAGSIIGTQVGGKTGAAITADSQEAANLLNLANQALALRAQVTGEDITVVRNMLHQLPLPTAPA